MVRRSTIRREMKVSFDTAAQRLVHGECRASVMRYRYYRQMAPGYLSELRRTVSALLGDDVTCVLLEAAIFTFLH